MPIDSSFKCRTCLSGSSVYYQLFDNVEKNYKILEMLDSVVPQINIKSTLQFSTLVCQMCVEKLLIGYKFQQVCIESNKRLLDLFEIAVIETRQKFEKIADPLTSEKDRIIQNETAKSVCIESVLNEEKMSDNDSFSIRCREIDPSPSICQIQSFPDELKPKDSNKELIDKQHNDLRKLRTFQCRYCPKRFEKKLSLSAHYKAHKNRELFTNKSKNLVSDLESTKKSKTITKEDTDNKSQMYDGDPDDNLNNKLTIKCGPKECKGIDSTDTGSIDVDVKQRSNSSSSKYAFDCKVCGKIFDRSCNLQRHKSVHSPARPYECDICKYRFSDAKIFKAHLFQHKAEGEQNITQHLPDGYKCEVCHRNFMSMKQLAKHFKNQHPEVNKHKCDYCSRQFILRDSLLKHINQRHKSDKSLLCQICKKAFGNAYRLKQHKLVHNSYLCPHCGKTFRGASNLRQHMERHTGLQKYQCPDCPKRFNCKSDVIKHASAHSDAKPYVCDSCGSRFTRKYSMQKHKSLHTAERSYKCDQCNMTFKLISLLKRHMRTHTGEKPYKCKYCERAYSESGDLTKHLRTHVGENTYMCDQCPISFKYQAELRQHQSEHYKMNQKLPRRPQEISEKTDHEKNYKILIS